jgi:hypothetical protein
MKKLKKLSSGFFRSLIARVKDQGFKRVLHDTFFGYPKPKGSEFYFVFKSGWVRPQDGKWIVSRVAWLDTKENRRLMKETMPQAYIICVGMSEEDVNEMFQMRA